MPENDMRLTRLTITAITASMLVGCDGFKEKEEWNFLQRLESNNRGNPLSRLTFHSEKELHAVGCWSKESSTNIWILLNPSTPPFYKQIPQVMFTLSKDELLRIEAEKQASSTVMACLESHQRN
jgi:hypothetical protein